MLRIIDYQAVEPISRVNNNNPITIPQSPKKLVLATIRLMIPRRDAHKNRVELIATVGVRGITGTSQLLFKIFRDGKEIFRTQAGVESDPASEVNYTVTFQSIESNLGQGTHTFRVTVENITPGTEAAVVGPISFSGLAIAIEQERDHDKDHSRDRDRESS
ncbi:exosporium protein C [Neobacillus massiliamazoniensis]|uniref:Exosporium protein C n=1 Tax=Neobacillus massiliamazoniensis TaxID=1499688 RepID=A0A0U1NSS3_9BACI|nr:exosporium protein C [Neobacillus massiliamazoniensis]CRK81077.1 exosporium protein C [Neobacillus massiliamazoniensis]